MADVRIRAALALALAQCAQTATAAQTAAADSVRQVFLWIGEKDCPNAVRELNAGLAKGFPEVA